jgi:hypothetical protein
MSVGAGRYGEPVSRALMRGSDARVSR